jgi:methionyl aminopeptidase
MISIVKTSTELELLRESGRVVGLIHTELKRLIKVGVNTKLLSDVTSDIISTNKGAPSFLGYRGYPNNICVSINEEIVHGFHNNRVLKEGDVVSVDVGVYKDKYHGDAAFTVIVGEPLNERDVTLVEATQDCLDKAIKHTKAGITTGSIGRLIEDTALSYGFDVVRDYVGHGIGRELHEAPAIFNYGKDKDGLILKAGMVICVEPMLVVGKQYNHILDDGWTVVTNDGLNAAHCEHQIIVHKDYSEIITI